MGTPRSNRRFNFSVTITKKMSRPHASLSTCVLLFSGGRDSSVAAIRLARSFGRLVLLTVKSPHMTGLSNVESRLEELKKVLSVRCEWIVVPEKRLRSDKPPPEIGCIGCHFGYFASVLSCSLSRMRHDSLWLRGIPKFLGRADTVLCGALAPSVDEPRYQTSSSSSRASQQIGGPNRARIVWNNAPFDGAEV
jgi:hypothetical protein